MPKFSFFENSNHSKKPYEREITLKISQKLLESKNYIRTTKECLRNMTSRDCDWVSHNWKKITDCIVDLDPISISEFLSFTDYGVRNLILEEPMEFSDLREDAELSVEQINQMTFERVDCLLRNKKIFFHLQALDIDPNKALKLDNAELELLGSEEENIVSKLEPLKRKIFFAKSVLPSNFPEIYAEAFTREFFRNSI